MIERRPAEGLGHFDFGWLDTRHHFSFGDYRDPARMGWGRVRVWNDDEIEPGKGFDPHPHRDMEIVTYVRDGAITHRDSLGNVGRTPAGDVQVMSAGTGIRHAEYNLEPELTRIFQIWILPRETGGPPAWSQRRFPEAEQAGRFAVLASGFAEDGALPIRADARVYGAALKAGQSATVALAQGASAYLVSSGGAVEVDGVRLEPRDGAAIEGVREVTVKALADCEAVLVETL